MRKARIVTHGGKSHRDEYLACCCIVFHEFTCGRLTTIERRVPGAQDLESDHIWVVDTGGRYDQRLLNFDHHQDDPALANLCALDLVLRHLLGDSAYASFRVMSPWLKLTALHDTMGASAAADASGIETKAYASTRSPIEKAMLAMFGELSVIHPGSMLMQVMLETGRIILTEARDITGGIPDALANAPAPFEHGKIRIWDIRSVDLDGGTMSTALVNHLASQKGVDVVLSQSMHGSGIRVYRSVWATARFDLCQIIGKPGVRFVHKNGFYATLDPGTVDTALMELMAAATL